MKMDRSWLVQRLDKPHGPSILGKDNLFAFGGGYKNGGLSDDAMDLICEIWSFDYMGAAEFEFGAVPEALQKIAHYAEAGDLVATTFTIPLAEVAKDFRDKTRTKPKGEAKIYLLCPKDWVEEVTTRIKGWAGESWNPGLKESTHLASVLRPAPDATWTPDTCGWLELDNGFLFFTDAEMWTKTCVMFGVETPGQGAEQ